MLALLAAGAIRSSITCNIGPIAADRALSELSGLVGERLDCSNQLKSEILMVRVKNVAWPDLKARLATVLAGEWRKEGGNWLIERPRELSKSLDRTMLEHRAGLIGAEVGAKAKQVVPWTPTYLASLLATMSNLAEKEHAAGPAEKVSAYNDLLNSGQGAPAGRALRRILAIIPPEELAGIPKDGNAVYSNKPTSVERALPAKAEEVLRTFNDEQLPFAREFERATDQFVPVSRLDPRFNLSTGNSPATRFVLTVRHYFSNFIGFGLTPVDDGGWPLATASDYMMLNEPHGPQIAGLPGKPIAVGDELRDLEFLVMTVSHQFGGLKGSPDRVPKLIEKWLPVFGDPRTHEPMAFFNATLLGNCREATDANLVADLTDQLLLWLRYAPLPADISCENVLEYAGSPSNNMQLAFDHGWLTLRPWDANQASFERLNRDLMGQLVRTTYEQKFSTVDELADYASRQTSDLCFQSIDQTYAALCDSSASNSGGGLANVNDRTLLRFWGALSGTQRAGLRAGGTIPAMNLSPAAKAWLEELVFGIPHVTQTFVTPFDPKPDSNDRQNIRRLPQEALPNGIPADSVVRGNPYSTPVLRVTMKDGPTDTFPADDLGAWLGRDGLALEGDKCPVSTFQLSRAAKLKLVFDFGHGYSLTSELNDDPKDFGAPVKYADLPADVRAIIEGAYKKGLKKRAEDEAKQKGRTIPPSS